MGLFTNSIKAVFFSNSLPQQKSRTHVSIEKGRKAYQPSPLLRNNWHQQDKPAFVLHQSRTRWTGRLCIRIHCFRGSSTRSSSSSRSSPALYTHTYIKRQVQWSLSRRNRLIKRFSLALACSSAYSRSSRKCRCGDISRALASADSCAVFYWARLFRDKSALPLLLASNKGLDVCRSVR